MIRKIPARALKNDKHYNGCDICKTRNSTIYFECLDKKHFIWVCPECYEKNTNRKV